MRPFRLRGRRLLPVVTVVAVLIGAGNGLLGVCGPFTDAAADAFCPFVLEIFYLGITTGTTPTTYDPASNVSRLQMAAFLSRSVDAGLKRGGRRAALQQFWTLQNVSALGLTFVGSSPRLPQSDGVDVWVANSGGGSVSHVRGGDGRLVETWTGANTPWAVLAAAGRVYVTGDTNPGRLYLIDPTKSVGAVTTVASNLGGAPVGIAFDGSRIWTANAAGSVSIVTPGVTIPWTVTTVSAGFNLPWAPLYDGANVWVTDFAASTLLKLNDVGAILQSVTVGVGPYYPLFDGTNIWVPNLVDSSISVVRASNGLVLRTLTGNGLNFPQAAAFDGQRILVTNQNGDTVSLWKAADLTPIGSFSTGASTSPYGVCSDGVNFWITLNGTDKLARF